MSIVVEMLECPRVSITMRALTPCASSSDAYAGELRDELAG